MGKLFALVVAVIAVASAVSIVMHIWHPPEDISVHGHAIDEQLADTMVEAGLSFLAAQFVLAFFVWKFAGRKEGEVKSFPGGAKVMVIAALLLVGSEILALGILGVLSFTSEYATAEESSSAESPSVAPRTWIREPVAMPEHEANPALRP